MKHLGLIVITLLLSARASSGLTRDDVLFYAPFDGTTQATIAKGGGEITVPTTATFVEGREGQAVLVGGKGSELTYPTPGNLNPDSGALSMWIKPVGWGKDDTFIRFYFRLHDDREAGKNDSGSFLWLYKFFAYQANWLVQLDSYRRSFHLVRPASSDGGGKVKFVLADGQWGHLLATWSGSQMALYANGQLVGTAYVPTPNLVNQAQKFFVIGGQNRKDEGTQDLAIDDVMILNRPVTPGEAKAIYEKGLASLPVTAPPALDLQAHHQPSHGQIAMTNELVGWTVDDLRGASYQYQILKADETKPLITGSVDATLLRQELFAKVDDLPVGTYAVRVELHKAGRKIAGAECKLDIASKPPWLGNGIGKVESVPAPWEPVQRDGMRLTCWGRTHEWKQTAMPAQITTQGQPLLTRPLAIVARIGGKPVSIARAILTWNSVTPLRAKFTVAGELADIPVRIAGYMDYDGFLWQDVTLGASPTGLSVDHLSLEIAMRPEASTLMNTHQTLICESGATRAISGLMAGSPMIWLGNERGGLQWVAESFKDWNLADKRHMLDVRKGADETLVRITFIDTPTSFAQGSRTISMGLQATPVKPYPADWRRLTMEAFRGSRSGESWSESEPSAIPYWSQWNAITGHRDGGYGYLVANPNTFKQLSAWTARHNRPYLYWNTGQLWAGDEVLRTFPQWGQYQPNCYEYTAVVMRHADPDARDYMIWRCNQLFIDNPELADKVSGYYLDSTGAKWDDDLFTVRGTRDLQQRAYLSLRAKWPQLRLMNHQSGQNLMAQLAFSDTMLTGEHLTMQPELSRDLSYHHIINMDLLRAEYLGRAYGIPFIFLPELARGVDGDEEKTKRVYGPEGIPAVEHLIGMLWAHDVPYLTHYVNPTPMLQAYRVQMAFGWDHDTAFHGYWENSSLVKIKANQSPVVVSMYTHKDKALFVVMNNSDNDAQVELTPNWSEIGVSAVTMLKDAYAAQAQPAVETVIQLDGDSARMTVPARNFRMLTTE
ncbi:MAG: LamG domain-containing protein [Phycisphaeraceae bacterium]|nr:LamG domain-containing protein [Phycisphaeraceae bacterium]